MNDRERTKTELIEELAGIRRRMSRAEAAHRLDESRLQAVLELNQMTALPLSDITDFALEEAVRLTGSRLGYLAFVNEDETVLTMHAWSRTAMNRCDIENKPIVYPLQTTGLWGEAVRQRRPIITNDYDAGGPWIRGLPEGHVVISRHMNVPVFDGDRIVLVAGVGNKIDDYDHTDIRQLTLLMDGMWKLLQRRLAEEELKRYRSRLEGLVEDRTATLQHRTTELEQERALLHSLMDNLPQRIHFLDFRGRYIRVNHALAARMGLADPAQVKGRSVHEFFPEEQAEEIIADHRRVLQTGETQLFKEEFEVWPNGHTTWAATTRVPLFDASGMVVGTFAVSRDITERKLSEDALRTSEQKHRMLYDSSRDAIMMTRIGEGFIGGNPAAIRLFGCKDEDEFKACSPADLSPEYQPDGTHSEEAARLMMVTAMEHGSHFFEWKHRRIDGVEFFATVLLTRMELEGEVLLQATVRDVSLEKMAAQALQAAKDAAEAASRAKSDFLANMSHEIRTPMNAIVGMTELLLGTEVTETQSEYLRTIGESADALLLLIDDILDLSRIEAGKLALEEKPFDLRESLGDTLKLLAVRAHAKGLELACKIEQEVPDRLLGDANRLRQIVVNLVGNGIKFTDRGEVVLEVDLQVQHPDSTVLHFTITDTGIGVPREIQDHVFEAFEQGDQSTTRRFGGTGLGLAISSRLVEKMGGRIWLDSDDGHGSIFHFTAEFGLGPQEADPDRLVCRPKVAGIPVLVVDDNATNRRFLEETLRSWKMRPVSADGVPRAIELLRSAEQAGTPYRLVLTDANMPGASGFDLAAEINRAPELAGTLIIMLTSGGRPDDIARCERLGISWYVLKPVKQSELFDALVMALGIRNAEDERVTAAADSGPPRLRPLTILLAEDSLVNQKVAVGLLAKYGHAVHVANDGSEAVEAVAAGEFDVVLMDVQMPEMDGFQATGIIRSRERDTGEHLPIIALTAHALKGDRERCLDAGMDDYVSKPINALQLLTTIRDVLGPDAELSGDACAREDGAGEPVRIDWSFALSALNEDASLLRSVAGAALKEAPRLMEHIRVAVREGDAPGLRIAAHTLKGAVRYFGESRVYDGAYQMEQWGAQERVDFAVQGLQELSAEVDRLVATLTNFLAEGRVPEPD